MDNIPVHLRITGLTVTNEDVNSRRRAAGELAATWGKISDAAAIVAKAVEVAQSLSADGKPPVALGAQVEACVQKDASAFLASDKPFEVGVCAAAAMMAIMKDEPGTNGWMIQDVYSNALWSVLGYQKPLDDEKRESLRTEVLDRARERSLASANKARTRQAVPDVTDLTVTLGEENKISNNFKKALNGSIEALTRNAALDREELDFLWWIQLGRSQLLNRQFSAIPEALRLVVSGIEGGGHLRRLPADVHRDIVLRTLDADSSATIASLLQHLGDDRAALVSKLPSETVTANPSAFPLLQALLTGSAPNAADDRERPASEWGSRALLETGLARMMQTGIKKQ